MISQKQKIKFLKTAKTVSRYV